MVKMKFKCVITCLVTGLVLLVLGVIIYFILPLIVRSKVNDMLPLKNGSIIYAQWQNPTIPAYLQFWFFNVDNPAEILEGHKPALTQIGPYTYREHRIKYNITFNPNGSVSYFQKRLFFFDRSRSVGEENDTLTALNIPLMVIGDKVKSMPDLIKKIATGIIHSFDNYGLFFTTSVRNLTWGYLDPVLEQISKIAPSMVPGGNPHVGLFYGKNNSDDLEYTVDAGLSSRGLSQFLSIQAWNGSASLSIWNDQYANMINGTDGSMFPPFLTRDSRLYVFQTDICRSIYATIDDVDGLPKVVKGVPALGFAAPDEVFADSKQNPVNKGFCVDGYCMGAGVLNLTKCVPGGLPIVTSQPHFLAAAPHYVTDVLGIAPSHDYRTSLTLEPITGLPLELQKKLQINVAVQPIPDFMGLDQVKEVVFPVVWLNESALIDEDLAGMLRDKLVLPMALGKWFAVALLVAGVLMVLGSILAALLLAHSARTASPDSIVDKNTAYHSVNND